MSREQLDTRPADIHAGRHEAPACPVAVPGSGFAPPLDLPRWNEGHRVRLGEHMRGHIGRMAGTRADPGLHSLRPQCMRAAAECARGQLPAAATGLQDSDPDAQPAPGGPGTRAYPGHRAQISGCHPGSPCPARGHRPGIMRGGHAL